MATDIGGNLVVMHLDVNDPETYKRSALRNEGRVDDTPEVHKVRLEEYRTYVEPVVNKLWDDGALVRVDSSQTIGSVFHDIDSYVRRKILDPEISLPMMARR